MQNANKSSQTNTTQTNSDLMGTFAIQQLWKQRAWNQLLKLIQRNILWFSAYECLEDGYSKENHQTIVSEIRGTTKLQLFLRHGCMHCPESMLECSEGLVSRGIQSKSGRYQVGFSLRICNKISLLTWNPTAEMTSFVLVYLGRGWKGKYFKGFWLLCTM